MPIDDWILALMHQLGYIGIALLMFLDNIIPPIPSEVIMPSAGYTASQGQLWIGGVILAGSVGSLIAAAVLYWIGYKFPQQTLFNLCERYGKYVGIKAHDLSNALTWFEQRGHIIVFFGRMIPAIRSLISVPAGMSKMPFWKFMLYSSLGTVIWTTFLACVGYYFGQNQALMAQIFSHVSYAILAIVAVVVIIYAIHYYRKKAKS